MVLLILINIFPLEAVLVSANRYCNMVTVDDSILFLERDASASCAWDV